MGGARLGSRVLDGGLKVGGESGGRQMTIEGRQVGSGGPSATINTQSTHSQRSVNAQSTHSQRDSQRLDLLVKHEENDQVGLGFKIIIYIKKYLVAARLHQRNVHFVSFFQRKVSVDCGVDCGVDCALTVR